jgi:hypothetical protein
MFVYGLPFLPARGIRYLVPGHGYESAYAIQHAYMGDDRMAMDTDRTKPGLKLLLLNFHMECDSNPSDAIVPTMLADGREALEKEAASIVESLVNKSAVAHFLRLAHPSDIFSIKVQPPHLFRDAIVANAKSGPCPDHLILDLCPADDLPVAAILNTYFTSSGNGDQQRSSHHDVATSASEQSPSIAANHIFFRVVLKHPSSIRSGHSDNKLGLSSDDIVIQKLSGYVGDRKSVTVFVHYSGAVDSVDCFADQFILSYGQIKEGIGSLFQWQVGDEENFAIPGFACSDKAAVSKAIAALMEANAIESDTHMTGTLDVPHNDPMVLHLEAMQADGLVKAVQCLKDYSCWQICAETLDILAIGRSLNAPKKIVQSQCRDVAIPDMTVYDLLCLLKSQGWTWMVKGISGQPVDVVVARRAPKVLWMKKEAQVFSRPYLQAMARLADVVRYTHVEHCRDDAYYKALFSVEMAPVSAILDVPDVLAIKDGRGGNGNRVGHTMPAQKKKSGAKRQVHERTYEWSCGLMTFVQKGGVGVAWQATCPRKHAHRSTTSGKVFCKKRMDFSSEAGSHDVELRLKHWINSCMSFATRLDHMGWKPTPAECPSEQCIEESALQFDDLEGCEAQEEPARKKTKTGIWVEKASSSSGPVAVLCAGGSVASDDESADAASDSSSTEESPSSSQSS